MSGHFIKTRFWEWLENWFYLAFFIALIIKQTIYLIITLIKRFCKVYVQKKEIIFDIIY